MANAGGSLVEIYFKPSCPYCQKALEILRENNIKFTGYNISSNAAGNDTLKDEMVERSGRKTVPQIFYKKIHHIGGCDDLMELVDMKDSLEKSLMEVISAKFD
jgi:glutaredoxin